MENIQIIVAFIFGVIFVITLIFLAVKFPNPTSIQFIVFRTVLALAAAGIGAMIPGFINIEFNPETELIVRAGGAISIFVIVFFFNPSQFANKNKTVENINKTPINPMVSSIWNSLDPNLQDAFSLAANVARRDGKDIISTRTLFASLRRLNPKNLTELFSQLPQDSLPEAISDNIPLDINAFESINKFSTCVQDTLNHLTPKASKDHRLTSEDIFVDISKYGKGSSVKRLRTHGVDAEKINELVKQFGWKVVART